MYAAQEPNAPPHRLTAGVAFGALVIGALACVILVLPYRSFDLDRFFAPKELALHVAALVAGVLALAATRRVRPSGADAALFAWIALSIASAMFATNYWLAFRAVTISISGAAVFWSARFVASRGFGPALAKSLAFVIVIGTLSALLQAYGVKLEFAALNRAPGGTFGNRNFMAHIAAAGVPLLFWCIASARSKRGAVFWSVCLAACAGALVLSRTRAAWLALAVALPIAAVLLAAGSSLLEPAVRRRLTVAFVAIAQGVVLALFLPNTLDWRSENPYLDSVKSVVDYKEGSGAGRLKQYEGSMKLWAQHPIFGVGPGNWPVAYPKVVSPLDASIVETTGMAANPWPSSDWVAALSERGTAAFLSLAIFVVLLMRDAMRARFDESRSAAERLAALAGGAVLLIAVLEGAFDAVLLLATPTIIVLGAAGALIPSSRTEEIDLLPQRRLMAGALFIVFTAAACMMGNRRIKAMRIYDPNSLTALSAALVQDPGSYRIQMRAADLFLSRGQCAKAHQHAEAAKALFPNAPAPRHVLSQCRG